MKGTREEEARAAQQGGEASERRLVLVVDDDVEIREMLRIALTEEGYPVLVASDGAAALALVEQQRPGVILLDMRMPVMDGWAFARAYAARPGPHAPILVMTAAVDAGRWAREIGASAAIAKPFDLNHLLETVAAHLR